MTGGALHFQPRVRGRVTRTRAVGELADGAQQHVILRRSVRRPVAIGPGRPEIIVALRTKVDAGIVDICEIIRGG